MALIGTIRKNGWILIVLMVLALGGFILMDVVTNSQRYSAGDVNTLGKVNGVEVKRSEFEQFEKIVSQGSTNTYQTRAASWEYFVEDILLKQEAEKLGLGVSKDELLDLEFGANISPVVQARMRGANGQLDRQLLANIKTMIEQGQFNEPNDRIFWASLEKEVIKYRLQEKVNNLAVKSIYTPAWQAEMVFRENNERLDYRSVRIPYEKVQESEIQVTDADYAAYLKENPNLFKQEEETRLVNYIPIEVVPTNGDTAIAREVVEKFAKDYRTTSQKDSAFVTLNDGVYDQRYMKKSTFSPVIADTLMRLPVGSIVGPYLDGGVWSIAKIIDRRAVPDSVRARHILIRKETPGAEKTIDSLMAVLKSGAATFDSVAIKNSVDQGSAIRGGDLEWMGQETNLVEQFYNTCFVSGQQGQLYKVETQFGWHLIEITGKKFISNEASIKAVFLSRRIEPSTGTQQAAKDRALALIQKAKNIDDLKGLIGAESLNMQVSTPLAANDYQLGLLGSGDDARNIVQWAFNEKTKVGNVSKEVFSFRDQQGGYFDSRYVVAALNKINPKGDATVGSVKSQPEVEFMVKNRKKAEAIKSKLQNAGDLNAIANQFGVAVDTLRGFNFAQSAEPRVTGAVFSLAKDAVSAPIAGAGGVYVVSPLTEKPQGQTPPDLTLFRGQLNSVVYSNFSRGLLEAMKKTAKVDDFRSRFY
jgi:peptidyl-prolyl cis-trans isomerase D